jgi:la-related protein 1
VLKFLTHNIPWYGPLYLAHTKLERDYGSPAEAFSIVERGLKELPRYGPLYFQAFRLLEKEDLSQNKFDLPRTTEMISRADSISRELLWKVHLEAAQMHERAAERAAECDPTNFDIKLALQSTRRSYAKAIALCPPSLSWKVWLSSGRTELSCGNVKGARELFFRAHESVSDKGQSTVLLECARLEEYCGDLALSRSILCKARQQFGNSDWKVWLSAVNLESRCGLRERGKTLAQDALNIHRGTGTNLLVVRISLYVRLSFTGTFFHNFCRSSLGSADTALL